MKLIEMISKNFADVPRPVATRESERSGVPDEPAEIKSYFAQYAWQEITWEKLANYRGDKTVCLYFMSPNDFLYYFPAYMVMTLSDVYADSGLVEAVVPITGGRGKLHSRLFNLMQSSYDSGKKRCIGYFLLEIHRSYVMSLGPPNADGSLDHDPGELLPEEIAFKYWLHDST